MPIRPPNSRKAAESRTGRIGQRRIEDGLIVKREVRAPRIRHFSRERGLTGPAGSSVGMHWFRLAAEQGHVDAQLRLSGVYFNGEGLAEDVVKSYAWLSNVEAQGDKLADRLTDRMGETGAAATLFLNNLRKQAIIDLGPKLQFFSCKA